MASVVGVHPPYPSPVPGKLTVQECCDTNTWGCARVGEAFLPHCIRVYPADRECLGIDPSAVLPNPFERKRQFLPDMTRTVRIGDWAFGQEADFLLIAGPCVIESETHALEMAGSLKAAAEKADVPFVFKASYDKANRTSRASFRGPGLDEGARILSKIKQEVGVKVLSDVHAVEEVQAVVDVLDVIQTPAYLCRQTDLLTAVGRTGKAVNVKKGQFLAPWDMKHVLDKVLSTGNENVLITERGSCFGYNQLVSDMRSLRIMRSFGFPVIFDASHTVQLPGGKGDASDGRREFILPLARAAAALGVDGIFVEVHERPETARCDGPNSLALDQIPEFLDQVLRIQEMVREWDGGPAGE